VFSFSHRCVRVIHHIGFRQHDEWLGTGIVGNDDECGESVDPQLRVERSDNHDHLDVGRHHLANVSAIARAPHEFSSAVEAVDVAICERDEVTNDDNGVDHVVNPS
jgi:hypothetical protein